MNAIARHRRVSVRSGHKTGKSTSACLIALWFAITRRNARVIMTSASGRQVREVLWREMHAVKRKSRYNLGGNLAETPAGGYRWGDGREIIGFSTDDAERMAGMSGENMLFILDEASGIDRKIFEAVEGNRAGGASVLLYSNPTRTDGEFFDSFHGKRDFYVPLCVSSEESPNVKYGQVVIPGLATREYIEEKRREWGPDYKTNPLYMVRVLGDFPSQSSTAVVSLHFLTQSTALWSPEDCMGPLIIGVDVARFGDDETVFCARRGKFTYPMHVAKPGDGLSVAGQAIEYAYSVMTPRERIDHERVTLCVDAIGEGSSAYDFLRYNPRFKCNIIGVRTSESAFADEDYFNLRSELWFHASEFISSGGTIAPNDSKFEAELLAHEYAFDAKARRKVLSKDDVKEKLGRSPDRADAFCLTFAPKLRPALRVGDDDANDKALKGIFRQ